MILSDRSRYVTGTAGCQTKRYWNYHYKGRGIAPKGSSIDLWTGIAIHKCLEGLYKAAKELSGAYPEREQVRSIISSATIEVAAKALEGGFLEEPLFQYRLNEQLALVQGLAWGYWRAILPKILAEYEIVCVEEEMLLDLGGVLFQTRPDLLLRRKSDAKLGLSDFKSSSFVSDSFVKEYLVSPQLASGAVVASRHLGEPVQWYSIQALVKGGRKPFTKKGKEPTQPRQYSSFCYAKHEPSCPPMTQESLDLGGYWYDKMPTWEMPLSKPSPEWSQAEALVELMPLEALYEQFVLIGPYEASEFLGKQFLRHLRAEELDWQSKLARLDAGNKLEDTISRSYQCYDYGSRCPYFALCFEGESPEGEKFQPREAHHEEEARRFKGASEVTTAGADGTSA